MRPTLPARRAVAAALAVFGALAVARGAQAQQPPPVRIDVRGVFGNEVFTTGTYQTVVVTAENRTREALRGVLSVGQRRYDRATTNHEVRLDLPPRATRSALVTLYLGDGGDVSARYLVDDERLGEGSASPSYAGGSRSVVVLADPPRIRGALLDLEVELPDPTNRGSPRSVRVPVGLVASDARSGDVLLPDRSAALASVALLVVSGPMLARLSADQRAVLSDWLVAGGRMLVFPRSDADLRDPFLVSLAGSFERFSGEPTAAHEALVPAPARGRYLRGSRLRTESFGGSADVGLGRVYVAAFDGASPPLVDTRETRELVRSVLAAPIAPGVDAPLLPYGALEESLSSGMYGPGPAFGTLRAALDPNESYKPGLVFAALILLVYVVLVGPVNFTWVVKRNQPTLALVTTPIVAAGCLVALLGVGYLGKGITMRYRRVEIVEAAEGARRGVSRVYTGFFLTRPATFSLAISPGAVAGRAVGEGGELPPVVAHEGARERLRDVRGRLWDTVFVREDRLIDLGGGITMRREGASLSVVENHTPWRIRGAVVVDGSNRTFRVAEIAPRGTGTISRSFGATLPSGWGWDDPSSTTTGPLADLRRDLGLSEAESDALRGVVGLFNGSPTAAAGPVLFAALEVPRPRSIEGFSEELDLVLVRVPAEVDPEPVRPAARPASQPVDLPMNPSEQVVEPSQGADAGDAGAADGGTGGAP